MRALTFQGVEIVETRNDVADPVIQSDSDVIVAVHRAGLCGSDLHQYHGREPVRPGTVPGHEFFGEVVAVGSAVQQFRVGETVFAPFTTSCGECFFCRDGLSSRCEHWQLFGYLPPENELDTGRGIQGAQAEFVRVPLAESTLLHAPGGLSAEEALLLGDNFTTGFFCADQAAIRPNGITVVIGCGSVGLCAIVAARFLGAETVLAIDPVESRRHRAAELGAVAVSPDEAPTIVAELAARTGRIGADSILEAVGNPAAQKLAFDLVRPGGVISAIGVHTAEQFSFSPTAAYDKNVTYKTGRCPVRSYLDRLLKLVQDDQLRIPVEQIVTESRLPLSQGEAAYRQFASRSGDCVKILLDPRAAG
ncbi:MAG: alcohol dehydrogenase family protein [Planctomycetota bacterium]|nr:alcohol dehydrogenase family protein [Planctomycetota bacterium]MDA1248876.1 alcohol dehydrogenase family protein [Planctomycetota bacterium]